MTTLFYESTGRRLIRKVQDKDIWAFQQSGRVSTRMYMIDGTYFLSPTPISAVLRAAPHCLLRLSSTTGVTTYVKMDSIICVVSRDSGMSITCRLTTGLYRDFMATEDITYFYANLLHLLDMEL